MTDIQLRIPFLGEPVVISRQSMTEILRFGVAGLLVTGIHALVAAGTIHFLGLSPALANGLAFMIANLCSYLLHTFWSFSSQPRPRNMVRFVIVSMLILLVAVVLPGIIDRIGLHYWVGIAAVTLVIPPLSFLLHRFWTYR